MRLGGCTSDEVWLFQIVFHSDSLTRAFLILVYFHSLASERTGTQKPNPQDLVINLRLKVKAPGESSNHQKIKRLIIVGCKWSWLRSGAGLLLIALTVNHSYSLE